MSDLPAIDLEALEPFRDDPGFLASLVAEFVAEGPRRIGTLRTACAAQDAAALRNEAHAFKGSARVFGAAPLADMCQALESMSVADEALGGCLERLEHEFDRVRTALQAARTDGGAEDSRS